MYVTQHSTAAKRQKVYSEKSFLPENGVGEGMIFITKYPKLKDRILIFKKNAFEQ